MPDETGNQARVFCGSVEGIETLWKADAARDALYSVFFNKNSDSNLSLFFRRRRDLPAVKNRSFGDCLDLHKSDLPIDRAACARTSSKRLTESSTEVSTESWELQSCDRWRLTMLSVSTAMTAPETVVSIEGGAARDAEEDFEPRRPRHHGCVRPVQATEDPFSDPAAASAPPPPSPV